MGSYFLVVLGGDMHFSVCHRGFWMVTRTKVHVTEVAH